MGNGIAVNADTRDILIARNLVHHNGASVKYDHGMYLRGSGSRVVNNVVYANAGFGIQLYPQAGIFFMIW